MPAYSEGNEAKSQASDYQGSVSTIYIACDQTTNLGIRPSGEMWQRAPQALETEYSSTDWYSGENSSQWNSWDMFLAAEDNIPASESIGERIRDLMHKSKLEERNELQHERNSDATRLNSHYPTIID